MHRLPSPTTSPRASLDEGRPEVISGGGEEESTRKAEECVQAHPDAICIPRSDDHDSDLSRSLHRLPSKQDVAAVCEGGNIAHEDHVNLEDHKEHHSIRVLR